MKQRNLVSLWLTFLIVGALLTVVTATTHKIAQNPHGPSLAVSEADRQVEKEFLLNTRQLTFEGKRSGEGYFSADGSKLIFQAERSPENPFFQIYLMDLGTGEVHRVSPGHGKTTCAWVHPGGQKVLFASTHEDPDALSKQEEELLRRAEGRERRYSWDYDEHYDIFESDLNGENLKKLTRALGYDAEASWAPNGRHIVFSSNRHGYTEKLTAEAAKLFEMDKSSLVELYLMNADGSNVQRLTNFEGYDGGAFFSPNGEEICWRRFSKDGAVAEIYRLNLTDLHEEQITRLGAMSWAPFYHPSGDYLIFSTNLQGFANFELYLVDKEGKREPIRVTYTEGFDGLPVFSPDGTQLLWTSNRTSGKQSQLFLADWNDMKARQLLGIGPGITRQVSLENQPAIPDITSTESEIRSEDLRLHVTRLASDSMEGRLTGTEGARQATEYVAGVFRALGFEPGGEDGTYFQHFEFTSGINLGSDNQLKVVVEGQDRSDLDVDHDWRPLSFSKTGVFEPAGVVFAGYGIAAPGTATLEEYDSFVHLDVRDKWVMVFRFLPEDVSPELRQHLARHSSLRYKAMAVRDRGARGLIAVSGPNSGVKQQLVKLTFDVSLAGTSIGAISVTDDLAEQMILPVGKNLKEIQDQLDTGKPAMGFEIPGLQLEVGVAIQQEKRLGRNVLALLRAPESGGETVVVGAHVDHLGRGGSTNSLAREEEAEQIHYGADDNASGVGGLLEIAQYLANAKNSGQLPMRRDLLMAAWSGEELGRLGSAYFTEQLTKKKSSPMLFPGISAYLNLDMVGRLREHVVIQGVGSSPVWRQEIERRNVPVGLPIITQEESYLPTDATSFYLKGIPILSAFTGSHDDYHTPRDSADKINYEGAQRISRLMALITRSLLVRDEAPQYVEMTRPEQSARRANLRAYLGTVPDYAQTDVLGMKLSGVAKGGPSEVAGVLGGDVIVELAGKKIENIYDYTYTIEALKVGEAVRMVVLRDGERLTIMVTPGSRD